MKLRFRANTLRLRLNQKEVESLAAGQILREKVEFPGNTVFSYSLGTSAAADPQAFFADGAIRITAPRSLLAQWIGSDNLGLYFSLPTGEQPLKVALEKDLVCIDGAEDEKDPHAFPREFAEKTC